MNKTSAAAALAAALLLASAAPALAAAPASAPAASAPAAERESGLKTVYGWARKSGNSAMIVTPHRVRRYGHGEGENGGWYIGRRKGAPVRIDYTEGLDFRQVNKKCGRPPAGHPYDTRSRYELGTRRCDPIHLYDRLRKGRIPVKVVYDPAGPMAVKVHELVLP
ncbi:hypothetical protein Ppa06_06780 [Planomonospora parontospora subsp. parontospora]|uniref:Uncharacterized protein n=2 Tax=Planomonospora parontospora TaxID=58119 RepID=A0AA37F2W7_9ACTN|nr:hypothetical protein [Planomonospora parontospora]GGK52346.1 hypothetical protein GCM10010126_09820 [Planomonospora parontospora]GII06880.1 hypothetical protein Ppa06_06780 [Planomonospora parontospora subsp. parontospora]